MRVVCKSCLSVNNIPKKDSYSKANCGKCQNSLLDTTPIELTTANFDEVIVNSDLPVVADFWAPWCGPCKMMAPTFTQVANNFPLKALFVKINTDNEQLLGSRFKIQSIPTLIVFKDGREAERVSGALDANNLSNLIKRNL